MDVMYAGTHLGEALVPRTERAAYRMVTSSLDREEAEAQRGSSKVGA